MIPIIGFKFGTSIYNIVIHKAPYVPTAGRYPLENVFFRF